MTLSALTTQVSAATWYENEYETFTKTDYSYESGWPLPDYHKYKLVSELTMRYRYKVTFIPSVGYIRTLESTTFYKAEHWCYMAEGYNPWQSCYTIVWMRIQNDNDFEPKWDANPLGNYWHWTEYPYIPLTSGDYYEDRAYSHAMEAGSGLKNTFFF